MIFYIIVLAFVQGLTEFLPVSSSGHLLLLSKLFGINNDFLLLSVILHVATLLSVLIVLRSQVKEIIKNPFGNLSKKLILATIPTVVIVILFKSFFDNAFYGKYLPFCFMLTAVLIVLSEFICKNRTNINKPLTSKDAIIMGIAQGVAVLPGISRSGATICTGLICGNNREDVAHFSFLMSVPIILASLVLEVYEYVKVGQVLTISWYELIIGFIVAFITGLFSVKFMLRLIEKRSLVIFAVYLVIIAILSFFVCY